MNGQIIEMIRDITFVNVQERKNGTWMDKVIESKMKKYQTQMWNDKLKLNEQISNIGMKRLWKLHEQISNIVLKDRWKNKQISNKV